MTRQDAWSGIERCVGVNLAIHATKHISGRAICIISSDYGPAGNATWQIEGKLGFISKSATANKDDDYYPTLQYNKPKLT